MFKKRFMSLFLAILMILSVNTFVFASDITESSNEVNFDIKIDLDNPNEVRHVVGDFEFVVEASNPRGRGIMHPSKTIKVTDLYDDANKGDIVIYGSGVYDGDYVTIDSYSSYSTNRPSSSDLSVSSYTISGNRTSVAVITSNIKFTGSKGTVANGSLDLYYRANGTYN